MKALDNDHLNIATTLSNIAGVYLETRKYSEAIKKFERCLGIQMKALGNDHPDIADTLSNIGRVYLEMGKYEEALKKFKSALIIYHKLPAFNS